MTTVDLIKVAPRSIPKEVTGKSTRYSLHLHFMFFKISFTFPNAFLHKKTNKKASITTEIFS